MSKQTIQKMPTLWTAEECYSFLNIGRSSWYAGVAAGRFPQPINLGPRLTRWKKSEILTFVGQEVAE